MMQLVNPDGAVVADLDELSQKLAVQTIRASIEARKVLRDYYQARTAFYHESMMLCFNMTQCMLSSFAVEKEEKEEISS